MKRLLVFCLMFLLLTSSANATDTGYEYQSSDWAQVDVDKAISLGLNYSSYVRDYRKPITRGKFAENAASLVAIEFGSNLKSYLAVINYRGMAERKEFPRLYASDMIEELGIMKGREDGDFDLWSTITRQEAAVILSRTYRAYQSNVPDSLQPISFTDQDDIADWALDDVQLMNHMGIMTGVGDDEFDPLGIYTIEQCLVTLLRLHEKYPYDGSKQGNPFAIRVWEGEFNEEESFLLFAIETDDYYIYSHDFNNISGLGGYQYYYIEIIGPDFLLRSYRVPILEEGTPRGGYYARPENPTISEDGTKLFYTATVEEDAYSRFYNSDGNIEETLLFPKGIYTVTMDLATGEQTYTRADLNES